VPNSRHNALVIQPLLDAPNPALRDNLLPFGHGLPHTRVVVANIPTLGTCEELLGCRGYVRETRIVHGLSQAQRVICDLRAISEQQKSTRPHLTHIFCSPQLSG
jgi:hypothetical protein